MIYQPVQGHSLFGLLPKTKLSYKEQENRLWCIQVALKPDARHKITSNMLRPYCVGYFFFHQFTNFNVNMERSSWRDSKKYWPSCTACSVIRRWCNHHFSAIFAKKVVETGILCQFYGLIYQPVQGHSLFGLLPKAELSYKEQENRLWCIQLVSKPDVQHKITSSRFPPYCIGYFFIGLTTNSPISRSTWKGQAAGNSKKFWPSPVLKAEMLLDTPIAASHGSLLAYHQNVYKPTAYTYTYMSDRLVRLESALNTASMMQCDGSW